MISPLSATGKIPERCMTNASPDTEKSWLDAIRRDWDTRARENARAYINWPDVPNEEDAFFASGKTDYDLYVTPFLKKMNFDPREKTALEIGCGIGRIARWMSQDFAQYIGVDVSPEMIARPPATICRTRNFRPSPAVTWPAFRTTAWISSGPSPCSSTSQTSAPSSIIFRKPPAFCAPAEFFACT